MAQHSARDAANDRAETELMTTLERYRIDARDAALTDFGLADVGGLRAARHEQDCHNRG
jgi:hypothetical protein